MSEKNPSIIEDLSRDDLINRLTIATELIGNLSGEINKLESQIEFGSKFLEKISRKTADGDYATCLIQNVEGFGK